MCQLNERAQPLYQCLPFQTSEMADTHIYFNKPILRYEPNEIEKLHRNSTAGLPQKEIFVT